jgi:hypothetical protein
MVGLNEVFDRTGLAARAFAWPSMFDIVFAEPAQGLAFFEGLRRHGVLLHYGGRVLCSAAMSDEDVTFALTAAESAAMELAVTDRAPTPAGQWLPGAAERYAVEFFAAISEAVQAWLPRMELLDESRLR